LTPFFRFTEQQVVVVKMSQKKYIFMLIGVVAAVYGGWGLINAEELFSYESFKRLVQFLAGLFCLIYFYYYFDFFNKHLDD
jgi:hypothetical protein